MHPDPRVLLLQLDQGVVGLHRLLEGVARHPELVVELRHAVEGDLGHEQVERRLLEHLADGRDAALGEVAVGRHVDLLATSVTLHAHEDVTGPGATTVLDQVIE